MRDAIDPDEHQYYQAMIWVSTKKPTDFDQWANYSGLRGARWHHTTLTQSPVVLTCSTALIVFDPLTADELGRFPDWAQTLESLGIVISAVIVPGLPNATNLNRLWHQQLDGTTPGFAGYATVPIFIGVETAVDAPRVLQAFNGLTYAPLLVCVDYLDLRIASSGWQQPCYFRQVAAKTFEGVLTELAEQLTDDSRVPLIFSGEPELNLEHFSAIADLIEPHFPDAEISIATQIVSSKTSDMYICWLEFF